VSVSVFASRDREESMQVFEAMTPEVVSVPPETTLVDAAQTMKELDVGPLPVCDGDQLLGMVTDRDIIVRAIAEARDPRTTEVREIMTSEVVCCREADDVRQAAKLMQEQQLRRLLVVNDEGRLVGIVSLGDIVLQTGDDKLAGKTLEKVSEPSYLKE
jgi:CBS domain-containing protein